MRYLDFTAAPSPPSHHRGTPEIEVPECLIICIDVSPSMEERDWPPSRLDAAKEAAAALIERKQTIAPEDEIGVVAYNAYASTVQGPVRVGDKKKQLLRALQRVDTASGTSISAALREAKKQLLPSRVHGLVQWIVKGSAIEEEPVTCRIVILTDGHHNTGPDPRPIAASLKRDGVTIDCVGIGGRPSDVQEDLLRGVASKDTVTGRPRYAFIGDKDALITKFEQLAGRITR